MKIHKLKTWPEYFINTMFGSKSFELRVDDRFFRCGDFLVLEEWDPKTKEYTGRSLMRSVNYILRGGVFGLPENMVIMSLGMV